MHLVHASAVRTGRLLEAAGAGAIRAMALAGVLGVLLLGIGPHTGRYRTMTVLSGSMKPTFDPGSIVVAVPISLRDVRPGQVIVYEAPIEGHPVVAHRVLEVVEAGDSPVVRTKGDNNAAADEWTARLDGGQGWHVVLAFNSLGRVTNVLSRPEVRRVINLAVPAVFLVVWMLGLVFDRDEDDEAGPAVRSPAPAAV